ncbi:MAG: GNAT family N-acetyltransferase [Alicyclobacillus sp.]|nr:GNAT family N-acetyltransferase [Alicyclobacillus sp.]
MVEVRLLRKEEFPDAIRLSDAVFRDAEQVSMGTAFKNVFSTSLSQSYGAFANGKLVSFMGLVPTVIRVGPAALKTYMLGSVCTDEAARGNGYASQILSAVQAHVDKAGAALMLISGTRSLYTRNYAVKFGNATWHQVDEQAAQRLVQSTGDPAAEGITIRPFAPTDWLGMHEVASRRSVRFEQSVWELAVLVDSEAFASCVKLRHRVLVAEACGQIVGFLVAAVADQGQTGRRPMAIEWAGPASVVARLLGEAVLRYGVTLYVPVPWQDVALAACLAGVETRADQNQGTVYVVSAERLLTQLRPYLLDRDAEAGARLSATDLPEHGAVIDFGNGVSVRLNAEELVSFLFDVTPAFPLDPVVAAQRSRFFPIPIPYTISLNYV